MTKRLLVLCAALMATAGGAAEPLVLADRGACRYQIVIPDPGPEAIVDGWLLRSAKLMQAAFATNGFTVGVVKESGKAADQPGIYLGATRFAKDHGLKLDRYEDWTYHLKAEGQDLIIAGNDRKDPTNTVRGTKTPLALLGTVKGVCDFLREYAGVRFLFNNMDQSQYATVGDGLGVYNADGSLKIDTRSIAFLPTPTIAVPAALDVRKTPMMRANSDAALETFYHIAMNFFPMLSSIQGASVGWLDTLPTAQYGKSHPEYFALLPDGRRACELKLGFDRYMQYCPFNPGVQDLMAAAVEKKIEAGHKTIGINPMDGYRLCACNCELCNRAFGSKAENGDQIHARGKSGKLWQAYFMITERMRRKHPDVKFVVLNYQDTPVSADVIRKFPENVIVKIQYASQLDFDRLAGVEFPAGICGFEETFTGFGQAGPYLPERTPEHIASVVKAQARNNVKWSLRDGSLGYVRGLQAPAYYVYGRMMDDPSADWQAIYKEFRTAAFGSVEPTMTRFFELLDMQLAIYSDYYGVMMPGWSRQYSRSRYHDSKWHVKSIFTPEYCAEADALLASAERAARDADVKARLHLMRIEFDYARKLARIFYLQDAWTLAPTPANLDQLIAAIDDWHADLATLADRDDKAAPKPLSDWPEMRPFVSHSYRHAALVDGRYQQQWEDTCINWDTAAIRAGILTDARQLQVAPAAETPGPDSKAWEAAPESVLRVQGGMPFANVRTAMKVLRDASNLYVRVECLYPAKHPEDLYEKAPDGDIFSQEYVELGLRPPAAGSKVYRLAINPVTGSRYDAVCTPDRKNRMAEDKGWNGTWQSSFKVSLAKGPYTLPKRVWTAWFRIPLSDFGSGAPAAGETWGFNAARRRSGRYMVWSDASQVTDVKSLGSLRF